MKDLRSNRLRESVDNGTDGTGEHARPAAMATDIPTMSGEQLLDAYGDFVHDITHQIFEQCRERIGLDLSYDNLFGYAVSGLLEAKNSFEPEHGSAFTTFAFYRIRGAILDGVRNESWGPQTSRRLKEWKAIDEQCQTYRQLSTESPAAATTAGSLANIKEMVFDAFTVTFLYDEHLETRFAHEEATRRPAETNELQQLMDEALEMLPERQREVIIRYHVRDETMQEIADSFGVSKSWVSRLNADAITELRRIFAERGHLTEES